jgi:CheY-like chemotaxis protein
LETVQFDVRELLFGALRTLQIRAAEKQVRFAVRVSPVVPAAVLGDPDRLRQVLINLVGNAVKFTDQGGITVAVGCHTINASEVWLEISVRDTGIGISEENQKHIFQAFAQGDVSTSRRFGGTGLGLAITSQLVELMGGRIRVESKLGRGSTFSFRARFGTTPRRANPGRANPKPRHVHVRGENTPSEISPPACSANILVAEDGEVNQKVVTGLLSRRGHRVTVAENGRAAVRLLEQGSYDLILMDIEMPEMDGLEATRVIRRHEQRTGQHIPIVAMTAHAIKGDRERFLVAGMDDYIAKPFLKEQLYEAVERHTANQRAAVQQPVVGVASVKTANCSAGSSSAADSAD